MPHCARHVACDSSRLDDVDDLRCDRLLCLDFIRGSTKHLSLNMHECNIAAVDTFSVNNAIVKV